MRDAPSMDAPSMDACRAHDAPATVAAGASVAPPVVFPGPVGVLVKTYPKVSETFVLNEILELERRGVPLRILSLQRPTDTVFHAANAEVRAPVAYVPARGEAAALLGAHLRCLLRAPVRYVRTLVHALRSAEPGALGLFARAGGLAALMRREGVSHLHAHFIDLPGGVAELASRLTGVGYSISAHAKDIYLSEPETLRRRIRGARFTVTCTEYNRRHLAAIAGADARLSRMYHGVDLERFRPSAAPEDGPPLLISVGRLREKKGFATLIEACRLLRLRGVALRCRIVGYGPEQERLERQIAEAGLAGVVELLGKKTHGEIVGLYDRASIFVLPCRIGEDGDRDGVPNSVLEAMAMELPVICSDVSGVPEAVRHGEHGRLVPPDDPAALAEAIETLLDDPALRARMGAAGRRAVADRFDGERNLDPLLDLLREAAGARAEEVGYVLMGYPRLSETFISNEIHLLESMGVAIRLFSVKRGEEKRVNPVIGKIRATPRYLPKTSSVSKTALAPWLWANVPSYAAAHWGVLRRRPLAWLGALGMALDMCWRYRSGGVWKPKKVFLKEFLQAGFIARDLLARPGVRHLHGHFCHGVTNITWFASRMTGLPFSFTAHAKDIYRANQNPGDLLPRKLAAARFITTCTAANEAHLRQRAAEPDKIRTVYHGLDTGYFAPTGAPRGASADPLILSVGRFVEKKGFDCLIDACAELRRQGLRFRCRIVGERGDEFDDVKDRIAEQVRRLGLEDAVSLTGAVTQEELKAVYGEATLFVLPCLVTEDGDRDGIPNVLAEAMAMGLPVVSTRVSGIPELVDDGEDGLLTPERDPAALSRGIGRVLEDAALRDRLGRAARRKICLRFDSAQTTLELKRLFARAMEAEGAGS